MQCIAMTIFETIQKLIRVQGYASLSSIAECSGLSKKRVLDILDANKGLFRREKAKIVSVQPEYVGAAVANARNSGKVFWQVKISYGCATSLEWYNNPEADKLRKGYCCGGLGDSYVSQVVLDTLENRAALEELGMKDTIDPKEWEGYLAWKE